MPEPQRYSDVMEPNVSTNADESTRRGQVDPATLTPEQIDERRVRFRSYLKEKLAYAKTDEYAASGEAWLARNGLSGLRVR